MTDLRNRRISREVFLAAIGENLGATEPWVFDRLATILEEVEVAAGETIYAAGDPPDHFYFLRQGSLELVRDRRPVEAIDGPHAFGLLDALVERPRSHSAYARVPLELLRVRMDAWLELLEDSFELARMSVLGLARGVASLEERHWSSGRRLPSGTPMVLDAGGPRLDPVERLALLMHTPPLRGAGAQPLGDLAAACEELTFATGERVFERGAPPGRIFVLIDGRIEATRERPDATWRGGCGEAVCGVASFAGRAAAWEAHAVTRARVLAFRMDDWFDVMEENFEMVRATLAGLASEHQRLLAEL